MSTDSPNLPTDAQLLYEYLGRKIASGGETAPADELLADLGAYREQLDRLRAMIGQAEQSLDAGLGRDLDLESLLVRVRRRLEAEGRAS